MLETPRFKPHLRVEVVPGEGAYVLSDTKRTLLRGRPYELVIPEIDGRPADGLCDDLQDQLSPADVYFVLAQLEQKGYLCEAGDSMPADQAALWSMQQIDPGVAARRLAETPVMVRALGVEDEPFGALLQTLGVRVGSADAALKVVLTDGYLRGELAGENAEALRTGRPWMLARPVGRQVWVGPLFRPGVTGCWECLAQRLRANRPVESYLEAKGGRDREAPAEVAGSAAILQLGSAMAANAVATWVALGDLPPLEGKIRSFDVPTWKAEAHLLVRLPYCPACGQREAVPDAAPRPIVLQGRPKTFTQDGGHRVVAPEVTLEKFSHHVSPITGAVTMLERVGPAGEGTMHVYLAGHNLAQNHHSLDHLRGDLRQMSSGKGVGDVQARASGLCEGLERYSAVFRGDEPRRRASRNQLGDAAVPLEDCLQFSARQYRDRDAWNARQSRYNFVPVPLDPAAEIEWTPVWSLSREGPRYLPTAFCYFYYPHRDGPAFCVSDSNGNAAGNTIEEAVLQGFLELVERDSVALWWYNRASRPGVDLDAFADPYLDRLRDFLRARGRELWALDLTADLGVPVFAALTRDRNGPEERIVLGFGAHLDARLALSRAVTEMNQMLAGLLHDTAGPDLPEYLTDPETVHWLRTATLANQPYLRPDPGTTPRGPSAFPATWSDNVAADVRSCQALVEREGLEMMVLDQTRPEVGLPVVKVIVPGLRHFWARFAPGRLFDVPVRLGWLDRPVAEADLNPIAMFL